MRKQFGRTLVDLAKKDSKIVLISGDVVQEMDVFQEKYPDRFYNMGITEQAIISIAAGMAYGGLRPIVYSITPFLVERPFEQIKLDVDEQNLPVILVGYADYPTHGPTHRPLNVRGLAGLLKNTVSYFPRNSQEVEKAMWDAYLMNSPAVISLRREGKAFV